MKPLYSIVSVGDRKISEEINKKNKGGRFGTVSSGSGQNKWLAFLNGTFGSNKRQVVSWKNE
jgi:hypothetical protein